MSDPTFFLGQPLTTGPYDLGSIPSVTVQDPNKWGSGSTAVQIQNATPYTISVVTGLGQFTIQGLSASTIPTAFGSSVSVTVTSGLENFAQFLTMVWLVKGQSSPMADGPLSAVTGPGTPTTTTANGNYSYAGGAGTVTIIGSDAPAGDTYQLYSLNLSLTSNLTSNTILSGLKLEDEHGATLWTASNDSLVIGSPNTFVLGLPSTANEVILAWTTNPNPVGVVGVITATLNYSVVT